MATSCTIGTAKDDWRYRAPRQDQGALSAYTAFNYEDVTGIPAYNLVTVPTSGALEVTNTIILSFFGKGAANKIVAARIWGLWILSGSYARATFLADLDIRLGSMATGGASPFSTSYAGVYADLVTAPVNRTLTPPGLSAMGGYSGSAADISFDTYGAKYLIIQTDRVSAGTDDDVGYLYRFG